MVDRVSWITQSNQDTASRRRHYCLKISINTQRQMWTNKTKKHLHGAIPLGLSEKTTTKKCFGFVMNQPFKLKRRRKVTNESRSQVSHNSNYFTQRVTGTHKRKHWVTQSHKFPSLSTLPLSLSPARETLALQYILGIRARARIKYWKSCSYCHHKHGLGSSCFFPVPLSVCGSLFLKSRAMCVKDDEEKKNCVYLSVCTCLSI